MNSSEYRSNSRTEAPEACLGRVAGRQWGVFSRQQALEAGFSVAAAARRMASGEWQRLHPHVYRMRGSPVSWEQSLMAAQLWAGADAAISHRSAAAVWKLDGFEPGHVELTTLRRRAQPPEGVTVHLGRDLAPSDAGYRGPFRVTGIVRTLIDLGAVVEDPALVEAAIESAVRRDPDALERLTARLDALGGHGRRGTGVVRRILALRDAEAAPTEGVFETRFERLLRRAGIPMPVRQYEVRNEGGAFVARLDFAWPDLQVAVEPDGLRWHTGREAFERGIDRANDLALTRWTVLHVTWNDLRRPEAVLGRLREAGL